jgi:LysM repeat protein
MTSVPRLWPRFVISSWKRKERVVRVTRLLVAAVLVAGSLAACGNDDEDPDEALATPEDTPAEEPAEEPEEEPEEEDAPAEGEVYEVQEGDTLLSISVETGVPMDDIIEANDLDDPDSLAIGDELVLPAVDDTGDDEEEVGADDEADNAGE